MTRKEEMFRMKLDGSTYRQIAKEYSISPQRVHQILSPPIAVNRIVMERALARCEECHIFVGWRGHVHHTSCNDEEDYNDLPNLQLLCPSCHTKEHKKK